MHSLLKCPIVHKGSSSIILTKKFSMANFRTNMPEAKARFFVCFQVKLNKLSQNIDVNVKVMFNDVSGYMSDHG